MLRIVRNPLNQDVALELELYELGKSLFEQAIEEVSKGIDQLYEGSKPGILSRYGEADSPDDELT